MYFNVLVGWKRNFGFNGSMTFAPSYLCPIYFSHCLGIILNMDFLLENTKLQSVQVKKYMMLLTHFASAFALSFIDFSSFQSQIQLVLHSYK